MYETDEIQSVLTNVIDDDIAVVYNFKKMVQDVECCFVKQ